ncbi:hypothetical protein Tco_0657088 [Tanacetum coccineum]|uniref:Reverse transcriptase domain-containing protein n=1 Tax=Tanacetum coccineum TaxID=301880 RepID=A0ABQ4XAN4_9ASTR
MDEPIENPRFDDEEELNEFMDDDQDVGDEEIEEWLMALVMPPETLLDLFLAPMRLEVIDDLCDRMSNLEYRHGELAKKMVIVSDAEVTDRITIWEIHPRVTTLDGAGHLDESHVVDGETSCVAGEETSGNRPNGTPLNNTNVGGDKRDEAFRILKEKLCNALVLALPDGPDDFVVYCDALTRFEYATHWRRIEILSDTSVRSNTHGQGNMYGADALSRKERLKPRLVRKPLKFKVGDRVLLKLSPWKGVVSNLKKCLTEPDVQVPLEEIEIDENLRFVEEPIEIVDRDVKKLKRRRNPFVKVR